MNKHPMRRFTLLGLLAAIVIALLLSPFASKSPDGLERVAEDKGFLEKGAMSSTYQAPGPDYTVPGIKKELLSTSFAGVLGTLLTFGSAYGLAKFLGWRRKQKISR